MIDITKINVEVSNRHVHLSKEHIDILFGKEYELQKHKDLSQPEQFAAQEKIVLIHKDKKLENVRVLGPPRNQTQIEISKTDSIYLGLDAPLKISGDLKESVGIIVKGPNGFIELEKGVIIAHRHLHVSESEAKELGINHNQIVSMKINGMKETILNNIIIQSGPEHKLALHIDRDDGEICFLKGKCFGELIID